MDIASYSQLSNPQTYVPGAIAIFTVLAALAMDEASAAQSPPKPAVKPLDSMILSLISEKEMTARAILATVKTIYPETTKSDVNSCLYKMLSKNTVSKGGSAAPVWSA